MTKKQDIKAIEVWQAANVERIVIKPRKTDHISDRIQIAIERGLAQSRQAYILNAVKKALEADGISKVSEGSNDSSSHPLNS